MIRFKSDWLLWAVFAISLGFALFDFTTGTKPNQQVIMIQLLGLGCGLIAVVRRRNRQK